MPNLVLDARFYGSEHTGLGRYTTNVLRYLPRHLPNLTLKILLRQPYYTNLQLPANCVKILCNLPHYSFAEQLLLPILLLRLNAQLFYTFHFNVPVLTPLPCVVTLHDLIKSYFTDSDTTTRSPWLYQLKRVGYQLTLRRTLQYAQSLIVPTQTVKNQVLAHFPRLKPESIHVLPEAPDPVFLRLKKSRLAPLLPKKYLLFVGNAYPHKNLALLLDVLPRLNTHLVIVSQPSPFLLKTLAGRPPALFTVFPHLCNRDLASLYRHATALVTPSLMEGYGLVGLEALTFGTPVVASDIPVYREVYGSSVTYFNPRSPSSLYQALTALKTQKRRSRPAPAQLKRSWNDVAQEIAQVLYESCATLRSS